jgi:hypothetical protein
VLRSQFSDEQARLWFLASSHENVTSSP